MPMIDILLFLNETYMLDIRLYNIILNYIFACNFF